MKKSWILLGMVATGYITAQTGKVGINTTSPNATLDIKAKTTDGSQAEGILIPQFTGDQLKTMTANLTEENNGLLVFATTVPTIVYDENTGDVISSLDGVESVGHYRFYYDKTTNSKSWIKIEPSGLEKVYGIDWSNGQTDPTNYGWRLIDSKNPVSNKSVSLNFHPKSYDESVFPLYHNTGMTINDFTSSSYLVKHPVNYRSYSIEGFASFSAGTMNQTRGNYNVALGMYNANAGAGSVTMGINNVAQGNHSFAVGLNNYTDSYGGIVLGVENTLKDTYSLAIGDKNAAQHKRNYMIGYLNSSYGRYSFTIGNKNIVGNPTSINHNTASSQIFVLGSDNEIIASQSFAMGMGLQSNYTANEITKVALGRYNDDPKTPNYRFFMVGNGTGPANRKNALLIMNDAKTGIGLPTDTTTPSNSEPTEMLDINGNIRVRGVGTITADGACTNKGTISYGTDGNFYGCTGQGVWKKLNN